MFNVFYVSHLSKLKNLQKCHIEHYKRTAHSFKLENG